MSAFRIKRRNKRNQRQAAAAPQPQPSQQQQQQSQPNPVAPLTKPAPNRPYDFEAAQRRYEATCLEFDSQPFDDEEQEQEYTKDELFEAIKKKYLAAGPRPSSPPATPLQNPRHRPRSNNRRRPKHPSPRKPPPPATPPGHALPPANPAPR